MDDMELVRQFARDKSERAFEALVNRHLNLVYSVALRQVRDTHLAEEVTQTVFIILARKAATFGSSTIISGWLCRTARFASAKALEAQRRRQHREQEAYMQSNLQTSDDQAWMQIEPLLDSAMNTLSAKDHDILALRFFETRSFRDLATTFGITEASAKMRVSRALDKLRKFFASRGLTFSAAVIAGALTANSVQAAPIGLATTVTVAAVSGKGVTISTATLIKTTLKLMAWTKLKTALVAGAITILFVGTVTIATHHAQATGKPSALTFAGYATPEASIQSSIWAGSIGDFSKFLDGCTPEQVARFKSKMAGKSDAEIRQQAISWAKSLGSYKITQKQVMAEDEVYLHITAPASPEGLRNGKVTVIMKKIGDEWKQAGDL